MSRIKQYYVKNQFIIEDDEKIAFQSYDSTIAIYDRKKCLLTLGRNWDYSTTTSKYLYMFIYEYTYIKDEEENCFIDYRLNNTTNKRAYIQKLIDRKVINYNKELY